MNHSFMSQAMSDPNPVIPMTALIIDSSGRLTYKGEDGCRRIIIGDAELLQRLQEINQKD